MIIVLTPYAMSICNVINMHMCNLHPPNSHYTSSYINSICILCYFSHKVYSICALIYMLFWSVCACMHWMCVYDAWLNGTRVGCGSAAANVVAGRTTSTTRPTTSSQQTLSPNQLLIVGWAPLYTACNNSRGPSVYHPYVEPYDYNDIFCMYSFDYNDNINYFYTNLQIQIIVFIWLFPYDLSENNDNSVTDATETVLKICVCFFLQYDSFLIM